MITDSQRTNAGVESAQPTDLMNEMEKLCVRAHRARIMNGRETDTRWRKEFIVL